MIGNILYALVIVGAIALIVDVAVRAYADRAFERRYAEFRREQARARRRFFDGDAS